MTLRKPLVINGGQTEQIQDGDALYFPFGSRVGEDATYIDFVKRDVDFSIFAPGLVVSFPVIAPSEQTPIGGLSLALAGQLAIVTDDDGDERGLAFVHLIDDVADSSIDIIPDFTSGEERLDINAHIDLGQDYSLIAESLLIGNGMSGLVPLLAVNNDAPEEERSFLYHYSWGDYSVLGFNFVQDYKTKLVSFGFNDDLTLNIISDTEISNHYFSFESVIYGNWNLGRLEYNFGIGYDDGVDNRQAVGIIPEGDVSFFYNTYTQGRASTADGMDTWLSKTRKDITTSVGLVNAARSIDTDGKYVYLGTYRDVAVCTLHIYDIRTDPYNPIKVSPDVIADLPAHPIKGIRYQGGYLYIAFEATGGDAFRIVDVTDPTNPIVKGGAGLTTLPDMGGGTTLDIEGDVCYVTSLDQVFSIDVSDKDNPVILDSIYPVTGGDVPALWTCKVQNGYVFVGGRNCASGYNHFRIIDATDPSDMSVVGGSGVDLPDGMWTLNVYGNYVYVAAGLSFYPSDNPKFYIIDVTDKANPVILSSLLSDITSPCSYIKYVDGYCYLVCWQVGGTGESIYVIDVNDPENPFIVAHQDYDTSEPLTLAVHGRYLYMGFAPFARVPPYLAVIKQRGLASATGKFHDLSVGFWGERIDYTYKMVRDGVLSHSRVPTMKGFGKIYVGGADLGEIETGIIFSGFAGVSPEESDEFPQFGFSNYNFTKEVYFQFDNDETLYLFGNLAVYSETENAILQLYCSDGGKLAGIEFGAGDFTEYFSTIYNPSSGTLEDRWTDADGMNVLHRLYKNGSHDFMQVDDIASGSFFYMIDASDNGFTAATGTQSFLYFSPKVTQSGDAGYSAIKVDVSEVSTGTGDKRLIDLEVGGNPKFYVDNVGNFFAKTGDNTSLSSENLDIDLSLLLEGLEVSIPIIVPAAYSNMPEVLPFPYALGVYDKLGILDYSDSDVVEMLFSKMNFFNSGSIGADLLSGYFWANWDFYLSDYDGANYYDMYASSYKVRVDEGDEKMMVEDDFGYVTGLFMAGTTYQTVGLKCHNNKVFDYDEYLNYSTLYHSLKMIGKVNTYNNVATKGYGVPAILDVVELQGQGEDDSGYFDNTDAEGLYEIEFYIRTTTADASAGTTPLTMQWIDEVSATTKVATVGLTATSELQYGHIFCKHDGSAKIQWALGHTGIWGDAEVSVYIVCKRVN